MSLKLSFMYLWYFQVHVGILWNWDLFGLYVNNLLFGIAFKFYNYRTLNNLFIVWIKFNDKNDCIQIDFCVTHYLLCANIL